MSLNPFIMHLLYLGVITLLPLIPAFLLYRIMPADAQATGVLSGIKFKLGGAFAGYLVLVVTLILLPGGPDYEQEEAAVWTLYADVGFEGDGGSPSTITLNTIPRNFRITPEGRLVYEMVGSRNSSGWEFPDLTIGHKNFIPKQILLDEVNRERDEIRLEYDKRQIHVGNKIVLEKEPQFISNR